jgi:hypothetical protein
MIVAYGWPSGNTKSRQKEITNAFGEIHSGVKDSNAPYDTIDQTWAILPTTLFLWAMTISLQIPVRDRDRSMTKFIGRVGNVLPIVLYNRRST